MRALLLSLLVLPLCVQAQQLPLFDAHLHYSHDAWDLVPVEQAIAIMRKAGLKRALISSSGDDGQQRLYRAAPDLVIPELRPYRRRTDVGTWFRDESVVPYLEQKLSQYRYVAIGEFHLYGADADLPVPRRMRARAQARAVPARALGCRRGRAAVQAMAAGAHPLGARGLRPPGARRRDAAQA